MDYNNIGMNKQIRLAIVFSVGALIVGCGFLTFFSIKNSSSKTRTIKNNVDVTMTSVHLENGEINPDVFYTDSNNGGTIEYKAVVYKVSKVYRYKIDGKYNNNFENGIIIELFGKEIYNNVE